VILSISSNTAWYLQEPLRDKLDKSKICQASQMWPPAILIILYSNMQYLVFSDQTTSRSNEL